MARFSLIVPVAAWLFCLPPGLDASEAAVAPDIAAPADATPTAPARPDEQLDEIIVQGTRLWQMHKALTDADDRFFARYNEINKDHDFDVHCDMEAPLGTRIKQRICRPAFQERAEEQWARGLLEGFSAIPPELIWLVREDEYRKNLLDVARGDPLLMKMLRERDALAKRYEAERKRRMKGRWIIFE
jgi:hypothetical protein